MKKFKDIFLIIKNDYRHLICISILIFSLILIPIYFQYAHLRILESLIDLKNSTLYYANELFSLNITGEITINDFTKQPYTLPLNLPNNFEDFKILLSTYWNTFFSLSTVRNYLLVVGDILFYFTKFLIILLPIITILIVVIELKGKSQNNDYNKESSALIKFKKIELKFYIPVKNWFKDFIGFVKKNKYYVTIFLWIWAYSFNIIAIVISFIGYYLFFIVSFKTTTLYIQVLKLLMDLSIMINFIPCVIWFIFGLYCFNLLRRYIAYNSLEHMENKDRGFINERPIVLMLCGTMGKKKTTIITDIAISQEIMFRDKAFEMILECDLKFPFFPWINLENSIKNGMKKHIIYNLATCRKFINNRKRFFINHMKPRNIWDYDYKRYGLTYDNKLMIIDIWDIIENYTQLYFIYIIQSSLLISNYSIRVDNILQDLGNFPLWNNDLFKRDSKLVDSYSRHSHIIDFDSLRLGKTIIENNDKANSFEFGVINITEIGKERGNNLELQTIKKNDDSCNQKNDLFNSWLKMVRHSATIDNYPFVKIICDEQRPESWGADARDLCEIVNIDDCSKMKLSMPFFFFEDLILTSLISRFSKKYYQYRFERADTTLYMYLYHGFISMINKYHKGIYNTFGYYKVNVSVENGTQDGHIKEKNYYLMSKKIYSKRFSTDCFSDYFNEKALKSKLGINDLDEFNNEKATFEEMMKENSYFFNDLIKIRKK